jgi:uncharacterized protein
MILPILYIKETENKGKGVFTFKAIKANTIIEIAPVIVMPLKEKKQLDKTLLHNYIFMWGYKSEQVAMALGYVPIYNHSYNSNCEYEMNIEDQTITITTVKNIAANVELTINYNGNFNDDAKIWFNAEG